MLQEMKIRWQVAVITKNSRSSYSFHISGEFSKHVLPSPKLSWVNNIVRILHSNPGENREKVFHNNIVSSLISSFMFIQLLCVESVI